MSTNVEKLVGRNALKEFARANPGSRSHVLLVGEKGAGRSTALMAYAQDLAGQTVATKNIESIAVNHLFQRDGFGHEFFLQKVFSAQANGKIILIEDGLYMFGNKTEFGYEYDRADKETIDFLTFLMNKSGPTFIVTAKPNDVKRLSSQYPDFIKLMTRIDIQRFNADEAYLIFKERAVIGELKLSESDEMKKVVINYLRQARNVAAVPGFPADLIEGLAYKIATEMKKGDTIDVNVVKKAGDSYINELLKWHDLEKVPSSFIRTVQPS